MDNETRNQVLSVTLVSLLLLVAMVVGFLLKQAEMQTHIRQLEKRIEQAEQNSIRSIDMQIRNNDAIGAEIRRINKKLDMELFGWH